MLTRERIVELVKDYENYPTMSYDTLADAIIAEMEEPLAVLAERKGWPRVHINEFRGLWYFSLWEYMGTNPATKELFCGKTYAAAESAARAYLAGQPNVERGGK